MIGHFLVASARLLYFSRAVQAPSYTVLGFTTVLHLSDFIYSPTASASHHSFAILTHIYAWVTEFQAHRTPVSAPTMPFLYLTQPWVSSPLPPSPLQSLPECSIFNLTSYHRLFFQWAYFCIAVPSLWVQLWDGKLFCWVLTFSRSFMIEVYRIVLSIS